MATPDEYAVVGEHISQLIIRDESRVPRPLRDLIPQDQVAGFVSDCAHIAVDTLDIYRAKRAAGELPPPQLLPEVNLPAAEAPAEGEEGKRRKR